jgi:hypothetical protein
MTLKNKTLLASLTLAILSLPACTRGAAPPGPGQGVGQQDQRVFYVSLYTDPAHSDQCFADWPQATLWKDKHQTVQWISDDGKDYVVDFDLGQNGSPFAQATFAVPANGVKPSGDLIKSGMYYAYGIRAGTNVNGPICKPASDPGLYVK